MVELTALRDLTILKTRHSFGGFFLRRRAWFVMSNAQDSYKHIPIMSCTSSWQCSSACHEIEPLCKEIRSFCSGRSAKKMPYMIVTRPAWIAHRLASSNLCTRKASAASWIAAKDVVLHLSVLSLSMVWVISLTSLWKGALLSRVSVLLWYFLISLHQVK